MMKLWPFINFISCVYACPSTTTTTSTTIKPTTPKPTRTYHEFYKFSHMKYSLCRDCQLVTLNLTALIHENDFKVDLGYATKYMAKMTTMSIKGTYLSRFKFYFEGMVYEEIAFLYSETAIYGMILYWNGFRIIHYIIRQLHPKVTIIEQKGTLDLLGKVSTRSIPNLKMRRKRSTRTINYGYQVPDDTLSWLYQTINDRIPDKQHYLFMKGNNDTTTRANVSVTIKYTKEFASHISVYPKYGLYLLSAHVIKVIQSIFLLTFNYQHAIKIVTSNGLQCKWYTD